MIIFGAMFSVQYPPVNYSIKEDDGKKYIFDSIRKKWLLLTPEEWVRQNWIQYLMITKKYPKTCIALEKEVITFENKKRFDIVVYDKNLQPFILIECKSQKINLTEKVIQQVLNYQSILQSQYIIITNGDYVVVWDVANGIAIDNIPEYIM